MAPASFPHGRLWDAGPTVSPRIRSKQVQRRKSACAFCRISCAFVHAVGLGWIRLRGACHDKGWPIPRGGAQKITDALISYFKSLGGEVETSSPVQELADLPPAQIILFDLTPRQILKIAGSDFSPTYRRGLEKFRYGPGVYKMDWALSRPIPWRDPRCAQAATVHLGGTLEQIARSEAAPAKDQIPEKPYVLLCQPSLFDPTRAPEGKHIAWAYCHVPHGSREDMGTRIEDQIERFAPGFRSLVLGRSKRGPAELEHHNANLVGGDISGGLANLTQLIFRPRVGLSPYATSNPKLWICSSSTPPGPGVHGMCGYWAALAAMKAHS